MIFNLMAGMYSAIYVAKKKTKSIMYTTVFSAVINIVINLVFVKKIRLYAAALSTLIAYMSMYYYRKIDSRKYVKIAISMKKIIIYVLIIGIEFIMYYMKSNVIQIINIILMVMTFILINKRSILEIFKKVKERVKCIQI